MKNEITIKSKGVKEKKRKEKKRKERKYTSIKCERCKFCKNKCK